jgi:hypothetical protein
MGAMALIPNSAITVGDVGELKDDWSFTIVDTEQKMRICLVFKGRKEANVSRRLMKEILARSIAVSIVDYRADESGVSLLRESSG